MQPPPILNRFGQPIGYPLDNWQPPIAPPREPLAGRYCRLEPLDVERHAGLLYAAHQADRDDSPWTYLPYGPFENLDDYSEWLLAASQSSDPLFFAIVDLAVDRPLGVASYLRITPAAGSIEVGHIHYSDPLRHSRAATEAMYLMMGRVFELGYRRYEWKCDALNAPSRRAALRLGFSSEGLFRQATVYKGRNRDTAWYAMIDTDWPRIDNAFQTWLAPANFGPRGEQQVRLADLTRPLLVQPFLAPNE